MRRKSKLLVCSLLMCMVLSVLPVTESSAEEKPGETTSEASEIQDENIQRLEETTVMDENANIYPVEEEDGSVENEIGGIALYSRTVSGTMVVNFNTGGNKVTYYTDEASGETGYTNGAYGADAVCLGTSGGKIRFMIAGMTGTVDAADVEVVDYSTYKNAVSYYTVSDGKLIHYISQNLKTAEYSQINNGTAPSCLSEGVRYYSYDGHYFYEDYEKMLSDYREGSRSHSVNPSDPFYNYYQFLPLRSQTGYSAEELDAMIGSRTESSSKLRNTGKSFVTYQNTYGVNALLAAGIAANESGWGTSSICQQKNNLFGLNAVDSSPGESADRFSSVDECIRQFMSSHMSKAYLYPENWSYNGGYLGNKGGGINVRYASDPYWGEKAAAIAWTLDGFGGNKDNGMHMFGVSEGGLNVNIRSQASTDSSVLYATGSLPVYPVLVLDSQTEDGFYKIQSEGVLDGGRTGLAKTAEYDFNEMYAYISADYVSIINIGSKTDQEQPEQDVKPEDTEESAGNDQESSDTGQEPSGEEQKPDETDKSPGTEQKPSDDTTDESENMNTKPDNTVQEPETVITEQNGSQPEAEVRPDGNVPENENSLTSHEDAGEAEPDSAESESDEEEKQAAESGMSADPQEKSGSADKRTGKEPDPADTYKEESRAAAAVSVEYTQAAEKAAPRTGDFSDFTLWAVLAAGSVLLAGAALIQRKNNGF